MSVIPESLKSHLSRLVSLSHIPDEFQETAARCLFELLIRPENFKNKKGETKINKLKRFHQFSLKKLPNKFLNNNFETKLNPKQTRIEKDCQYLFQDKYDFLGFIIRQNRLAKKHKLDLRNVHSWGLSEEETEPLGASEIFEEHVVLTLPPGRSNIIEEVRRIMETTDKFEETPEEEADLDIGAEIERLNFGGIPLDLKCLGVQVGRELFLLLWLILVNK